MADSDGTRWWFCVEHQAPEHGNVCGSRNRLGPFPDEATAARAPEIARARTEAADAYDADS
ncbi:hypothetical protein ACHIPZ_05470 [Antrihabitans sp. NCIMB 15449]|jgi:hypothetical protein|uniref:SPOR domain-containing protein n=2 Tax=Antrihabitans TaxID=2799491 RepID=A0A934NPC3_9NOCA|nr:hypothetical protein [Antrihabitans stalagmiti]MBJ8338827.1 hypothetical protein [Antrihabitans stalagmiti]